MVNSAYYGLQSQVSSVSQAASLLGRKHLQEILMGTVLVDVFRGVDELNFCMRDFWWHSIMTAIISRHLAMQNASVIDHDAFFTAGLLHDIGRLIIAKSLPDSIVQIEKIMQSEQLLLTEAELAILGFTHTEVSAAILKHWGMPQLFIQSAGKHHDVDHLGPFAIDTGIVYLANSLSELKQKNNEIDIAEALDCITNWEQAACSFEQVAIACQLAEEQVLEVLESLGMVDLAID